MRQLFQIKEVKIIPIWFNEISYILYNTYIGIFGILLNSLTLNNYEYDLFVLVIVMQKLNS